jgi:hypothetical protein
VRFCVPLSQAGDYLTLHVFKAGGRRVYYPSDDAFCRGVYSNNPHTLVRTHSNCSRAVLFEGSLFKSCFDRIVW